MTRHVPNRHKCPVCRQFVAESRYWAVPRFTEHLDTIGRPCLMAGRPVPEPMAVW